MELTPMMYLPSGVVCSFPLNCVVGRGNVGGVSEGGVTAAGGNCTASTCCELDCVPSKINSVFAVLVVPDPSVDITARPSIPTATPSGWAGSDTVLITVPIPAVRLIALRVELS